MTRWAARLLALGGFLDAAYLTASHYAGSDLACGPGGGCELVTTSRFATVGPIPIAAIGVGYYVVVNLLVWTPPAGWNRGLARGLVAITGIAVAASAALFYLQAAVIGAWCVYCLLSAAVTVALFATAIALYRSAGKSEARSSSLAGRPPPATANRPGP